MPIHKADRGANGIVQLLMSRKHAPVGFVCQSGLLYIKLFILTSRFRKWLLRIFSKSFEGQGHSSKVNAIKMDRPYIY